MKPTLAAAAPADDYQAQDDLRTLTQAEAIKGDAKRHAKALSHGKQKVADMQAVLAKGEGAGDKDSGGLKEGSVAEEALDAKEAKAKPAKGKPVSMKGLRVVQRAPKKNGASVI